MNACCFQGILRAINYVILFLWIISSSYFFYYPHSLAEEPEGKIQYTWTLEEVKKIAMENNPDLKSARSNHEAASKGIGIAVSSYLPHIDVYAKFEQTTLPSSIAGSTLQLGKSLPYQMVTITLNQTLFDFGKALNEIGSSRATSNAAEQEAFSVRNALDLASQKAFYEVQSSAQLVEVVKKAVTKFEETYKNTQVLVRTGTKPTFDLTQARVELAKAKLSLISTQNTYDLAKIALLNLMGIQEQIFFSLVDSGTPAEFTNISSAHLDLQKLVQQGIEARPEIKRRKYGFEALRSHFSSELKDYLPTVSFQGWLGKYLPNYNPVVEDSWGVAIVGRWNILDGLKTTFRTSQLSAEMNAQEALVEKERLSIVAEVTSAYRDLGRSEKNLEVAQEAFTASKENFSLAQKRYHASVATILELLTAQTSLLDAEATEVTARFGHEIALATLKRAINAPLKD